MKLQVLINNRRPSQISKISSLENSPLLPKRKSHLRCFTNLIRTNSKQLDFSPTLIQDFSEISVLKENYYLYFENTHLILPPPMPLEDYATMVSIREKNQYELISQSEDKWPLLEIRKAIKRTRAGISELCMIIVHWQLFEVITIAVILMNTIVLAADDPLATSRSEVFVVFDTIFLAFYTTECILKILSYGFIIPAKSYLRESWNVLDFTIVVTAWVDFLFGNSLKLQALRALRVLRPLRSISSIEGLRIIFLALVSSLKPLMAALTIFVFFIAIFAIAGLQLWSGLLTSRCLNLETGVIDALAMCGTATCSTGYICAKTLDNPNYGMTSFDNFFFSALTVYQCITLEGWTSVMIDTQMAFNDFSIILFVPMVFFGAFIFLNLTLAIIKTAFSKSIVVVHPKHGKVTEVTLSTDVIAKHLSSPNSPDKTVIQNNSFDSLIENSDQPMDEQKEKPLIRLVSIKEDHYESEQQFNPGYLNPGYLQNHEFVRPSPIVTRDINNGPKSRTSLSEDYKQESARSYKKQKTFKDDVPINSATTMLSRMQNTLKLKKKVFDRIIKGDKFEETTVDIMNYELSQESQEDVIPKNYSIDQITRQIGSIYEFSYKAQEENPDYPLFLFETTQKNLLARYKHSLTFREVFTMLVFRSPSKSTAFFTLCPKVSQIIKQQSAIDLASKSIKGDWSAYDISENSETFPLYYSDVNFIIWNKGFSGFFQKLRYPLNIIVTHSYFNLIMTLCVITNTIVLSMDYYGISLQMSDNLSLINTAFAYIFLSEMTLKLIAFGLVGYCRDTMNYFDASIVILSVVELIYLNRGKSAISAFRVVRVFRILRVLRIARIFRYMRSMSRIMQVLGKSMSKFIYLALLLLLFLIIYSLLAMQVFGGRFNFYNGVPRSNFDSFHWSFVTTFQVLSIENWQSILYNAMRSSAGYSSCLFLISWIFLGNYVMLNLFLAILLDSFSENNDEEFVQSLSIFSSRGKKKKNREEKIKIIENLNSESDDENNLTDRRTVIIQNLEGKSYFIFPVPNCFRQFCIYIYTSSKFEPLILVLISITSIKLAVDTYLLNSSQDILSISANLDIAFIICFILEFVIKTVSCGFLLGPTSYLKDNWNYIDLIIVIISIIDVSISSLDLSQIKIIRLLRTMRPLRYISHNLSMKVVVTALIESLAAILNVTVVLIIIWVMFAILGISLFGGKLYHCSNPFFTDDISCIQAGSEWKTEMPNFDNIINAMTTLFILSSEEGWPDIMDKAIDGRDIGLSPVINYNQYAAYYFVVFITVSSFFFMNLFIGVVFEKFTEARNNHSHIGVSIMTKEQMMWIELQQLIIKSTPGNDFSSKPSNVFRGWMFVVSKSAWFKIGILLVIILNMLQMAMLYDGAPTEYLNVLDYLNLAFTSCFILEAFVKITGLGLKSYLQSGSNKFDFFVVITSVLDIILTNALNSTISLLRIGPQLIRIIRVLRVSRLVRLFKSMNSLKSLIDVIGYSLPAIANVMSLLTLIYFIYAIVGVYLFNSVTSGVIIGEYTNFSNFGKAMITLFRCSTGEDWYTIMYDTNQSQNLAVCIVYFISFISITTFIMLNLFIMVIIQNYEEHDRNPTSALHTFNKEIKKIKLLWGIYAKEANGIRVKYSELVNLIQELEELGVKKDMNFEQVMKILKFAEFHPDANGYVYYNDFLYVVLRRKYFIRGFSMHYKKLMANEENKSKKAISNIIVKERAKLEKDCELNDGNIGNFFINTLYLKTIIRSWQMYTRTRKENKRSHIKSSISSNSVDFEDPIFNSDFSNSSSSHRKSED